MKKRVELLIIKTVGIGVEKTFAHLIPQVQDLPEAKERFKPGICLLGPNMPIRGDFIPDTLQQEGFILIGVDQRRRPGADGHGSVPVVFRTYRYRGELWRPEEQECHRWLDSALRRPWGGAAIHLNPTLNSSEYQLNVDLVSPRKKALNTDAKYYSLLKLRTYTWVEIPEAVAKA